MKVRIVSDTRMARHGVSKSLLPILLFLRSFATWAQNLPSPKAPLPDQSISFSTKDTPLSELLNPTPRGIWENGVGEGFRSKTQSLTVSAGATYGLDSFGSREQHHLAMGSLTSVDGGAGVTATSIGPPDLSGTFEFNLQAGTGIMWFLRHNLALSLDAHYVHRSCADWHKPHLDLNGLQECWE